MGRWKGGLGSVRGGGAGKAGGDGGANVITGWETVERKDWWGRGGRRLCR